MISSVQVALPFHFVSVDLGRPTRQNIVRLLSYILMSKAATKGLEMHELKLKNKIFALRETQT